MNTQMITRIRQCSPKTASDDDKFIWLLTDPFEQSNAYTNKWIQKWLHRWMNIYHTQQARRNRYRNDYTNEWIFTKHSKRNIIANSDARKPHLIKKGKESCEIWTSHVTHINESCHIWIVSKRNVISNSNARTPLPIEKIKSYAWVMWHVSESCHTYHWVMSQMNCIL